MDFHTHNLNAEPGTAIVNLPEVALLYPDEFELVEGGLYSAGVHPWWTSGDLHRLWSGLEYWANHPQVVAVGECGLDKLKGAALDLQKEIFKRQLLLAEHLSKPVTIHCVKAFGQLLSIRKTMQLSVLWTVHGFRGKPELAKQLLAAGFNLSFGTRYNAESYALTPADRRYRETDEDYDERKLFL